MGSKSEAESTIALQGTNAKITRDGFARLVRVYYKVIKDIVLSDNLQIEQSKHIRRLEIGEVTEVIQGPALDPAIGIYRINVRAFKDGLVGWVTVAGSSPGVIFLVPGGSIFRVMKPTYLTLELRDLEGTSAIKALREGD